MTVHIMKDISIMTRLMEKEFFITERTVLHMMDNGWMKDSMVMDNSLTKSLKN